MLARTFRTNQRVLMRLGCGLVLFAGGLFSAQAQGIFTCVDGTGRKITADRPIADCADREQHELSRSGVVVRKLSPPPTANERAAQEARDKAEAALQARFLDDKRRERALMLRYPNAAALHRDRIAALALVDEVIASSRQRSTELVTERKAIANEMEFYAKDPSKAPFALKSRSESNEANMRVQQTFVASQVLEQQRLNQRFDEELQALQVLWARSSALR